MSLQFVLASASLVAGEPLRSRDLMAFQFDRLRSPRAGLRRRYRARFRRRLLPRRILIACSNSSFAVFFVSGRWSCRSLPVFFGHTALIPRAHMVLISTLELDRPSTLLALDTITAPYICCVTPSNPAALNHIRRHFLEVALRLQDRRAPCSIDGRVWIDAPAPVRHVPDLVRRLRPLMVGSCASIASAVLLASRCCLIRLGDGFEGLKSRLQGSPLRRELACAALVAPTRSIWAREMSRPPASAAARRTVQNPSKSRSRVVLLAAKSATPRVTASMTRR